MGHVLSKDTAKLIPLSVKDNFTRKGYGISALATALMLGAALRQKQISDKKREAVAQQLALNKSQTAQANNRKDKIVVNMAFFRKLGFLLKIMIPGVFTAEFGFLMMVAASMVARTYCDVWMIKNGTAIERSIISRDRKSFVHYILRFISVMLPISIVNSVLKYSLQEVALRCRTRLTNYLYQKYLKGFTYYISNLDNRIANADQLLTQDVERFCQSVSDLYSNVSKPILDIIIYAFKLTGAIGGGGPSTMLAYLAFSGVFLTTLRKPISRYTVVEQQLEGEFRYVNSRMITNSEEIAFYVGNKKENEVIQSSFQRLINHLRKSMQFRFSMGVVDNMIAKYWATVVGYAVVSRPFLDMMHPRHAKSNHSEIMEDYYRSGRMLVNLASAVGRLVLAGRELTRLAGFTARVTDLINVLNDLNNDKYVRTMVTAAPSETGKPQENLPPLIPNSGKIIETDHLIRFENVPVATPNGDILLRNLNIEVKSGMNVLIAGPNGCGKSSLFRILGGLWPLFGGTLTKPARGKLFYIPQRPYMTLGSLRDQLIYPHTKEEYLASGMNDDTLLEFLKQVHLEYLVERHGGWDAIQDWMDVLSGGEKQRVAMARVFYHKPQFAILDECTSAVSIDVEGFMYTHCKQLGITLFTVSHRKTLWKYHEYILQFDGRGGYEFKPIQLSEEDKK